MKKVKLIGALLAAVIAAAPATGLTSIPAFNNNAIVADAASSKTIYVKSYKNIAISGTSSIIKNDIWELVADSNGDLYCRNLVVSYLFLCNFEERAEIAVAEAVKLSLSEYILGRNSALVCEESFFLVNEFLHLLDEVLLYLCELMELVNSCALAESLIHYELSLAGGETEL